MCVENFDYLLELDPRFLRSKLTYVFTSSSGTLSLLFLLTQLTFGMLFLEFVAVRYVVITSMISLMLLISPLFERTFDILICFFFFLFFFSCRCTCRITFLIEIFYIIIILYIFFNQFLSACIYHIFVFDYYVRVIMMQP